MFLGDVYDDLGDSPAISIEVARWRKEQLADSRNVFVLGNHDMPYAFEGNPLLRCSAYTEPKRWAISGILTPADWGRSVLRVAIDGWLITHAGRHASLMPGDWPLSLGGFTLLALLFEKFQ